MALYYVRKQGTPPKFFRTATERRLPRSATSNPSCGLRGKNKGRALVVFAVIECPPAPAAAALPARPRRWAVCRCEFKHGQDGSDPKPVPLCWLDSEAEAEAVARQMSAEHKRQDAKGARS